MSVDIALDEVIYLEAIASDSTGAATDADSTPTFEVFEEATDTDIGVGGSMTKRTSKTGDYRASFTQSAANGFELGKMYSAIGSATIGGVAVKGVLKTWRCVAAEAVAGYPKGDTQYVNGASQTAGDIVALINTLDDYVDTEIATIISTLSTIAGYIDTEVAAIKAKTDNLPSDPADASDIAASFASVASTLSTIASYIDTEVAAIKAKTDNLPADPADASDIAASFSTVITDLATIAGYIDTEVAAIKAKTDNLPTDPADASDIAASFASLSTSLSTLAGYVDTEVAAIKVVTDRLSGMLQLDGLGPLYQFTDDALEQAPAGGGGGGGTTTGFSAAALAQLAGLIVSISPTFSSLRNLQIVNGDDYEDDIQNALTITLSGVLQDLDGASAALYWERGDEQHTWPSLSITEVGDDWVFKFERTAAQTATMTVADDWNASLVVTLSSSKRVTLARTRSAKVLDAFDD